MMTLAINTRLDFMRGAINGQMQSRAIQNREATDDTEKGIFTDFLIRADLLFPCHRWPISSRL
jgi:hypothetical protein